MYERWNVVCKYRGINIPFLTIQFRLSGWLTSHFTLGMSHNIMLKWVMDTEHVHCVLTLCFIVHVCLGTCSSMSFGRSSCSSMVRMACRISSLVSFNLKHRNSVDILYQKGFSKLWIPKHAWKGPQQLEEIRWRKIRTKLPSPADFFKSVD